MRFDNYKLRIYYKLNKLKKGKWGKENSFIYFYGNEIPSFNSMEEDVSTRKIYEGDSVIYKNVNKPNHPNNGLKAIVSKVHKPLKLKEKIEAWERNRRGPYPLEEKKYDLVFVLDEDEKEERRMSLVEGSKRGIVKRRMEYVDRSKIEVLPEKILLITVKKNEINRLSKRQKEKFLKKKVKILLNRVFKNGLEFKPKYVDKTSKNYQSWEERNREEGFFQKRNEKVVQKGDFISTVDTLDKCRKKTFKKPTKNYKINNFNILSIDVSDALKVEDQGFYLDQLETEYYSQEGLKQNDDLLNEVRAQLVEIRGNIKIRDSSRYARSVMEKRNILRNTKKNTEKLKKWKIFLSRLMLKKVLNYDLNVNDNRKEKEWLDKVLNSNIFDFISDNNYRFALRPIIEQVYIIRQILGKNNEPSILSNYIEDISDFTLFSDEEKLNELRNILKKYGKRSITSGNIPRIIVKLKFYLRSEDELASKLGFGPRCEQVMDNFKSNISSLIGSRKKKKKKKKTRKNRAKAYPMEEKYMGGRKKRTKRKRRKKKRTRKR